ncbi:hypothetical protein M8J76_010288 [Diaphorina citri]|nr:hypothetical protein M8J76_010288 [Diaphorina citri]
MTDSIEQFAESFQENVRLPGPQSKVYKDECIYSFDTPDYDTGLYVCLKTFLGVGKDFLEQHMKKTDSNVYLHIKRTKTLLEDTSDSSQNDGHPEKKITRLAIGVEGGFDPDASKKKYDIQEKYSIVVLPSHTIIPYPNEKLPSNVTQTVEAILKAESARKLAELEALAGTWDGEVRMVSKHAETLVQLDNGKKIPPSGWKCEKCDLTNNLWLNLTDGSILCGRKFFDGSGGNDHAVEQFKVTGYPLAVKLGTITKDGKADVFSYDEDDMVEDPLLAQHLAHWGINISNMEKTEKSMVELELDLNQSYGEWAALLETGSNLQPVYGPGYTGMYNLGNSCYMNSVVQALFIIPDFVRKFNEGAETFFKNTAKLARGLLSGRYSRAPVENGPELENGIHPYMFKNIIGKGHPDFSTKKQQDAQEFFLHMLTLVQRSSRNSVDPTESFKMKIEEKYQCTSSNKVRYNHRTEYCVPLTIPMQSATNKAQVEEDPKELVRARITFASCIETFGASETIDQFFSSAINAKTTANKTTRLASFPDYLMFHLKKFTMKEDWTLAKLDVEVEMPDTIDLTPLRGSGPQPGEEMLPEVAGSVPEVVLDPAILAYLGDMGFPPEACKKAVYFTNNAGPEPATQWIMQHMSDSDFGDPFVIPGTTGASKSAPAFVPNEDAVDSITSMGFTRPQAIRALKETNNNVERAVDYIFSHAGELDSEPMDTSVPPQSSSQGASTPSETYRDGSGKYRLVAFISHMGTSASVGHYVVHILRDNHWVLYNDEKVALSENPPKELGYLYLYERIPS